MTNKKGFSLVEIIIALTVLALISAAVLSTVLSVNAISKRSNDKLLLGYSIESIVDIYYNTSTVADFEEDMGFCFGDDKLYVDGDTYKIYFNDGESVADTDSHRYTLTVTWTASKITIATFDKVSNVATEPVEYEKL